jgi:uridine kinase
MSKLAYVVAIDGPSGGGKSTLAENIKKKFVSMGVTVGIINIDRFYANSGEQEERNYDEPRAFDSEYMKNILMQAINGQTVRLPRYDYVNHCRDPNITDEFLPVDIIIVEGILVYWWPELRELYNLAVYVDVKQEECLIRRTMRDITERGRTMESVFNQFRETVSPAFEMYIYPLKKIIAETGGIIIPKGGNNQQGHSNIIGRIAYDLGLITHDSL